MRYLYFLKLLGKFLFIWRKYRKRLEDSGVVIGWYVSEVYLLILFGYLVLGLVGRKR